ncbi:MAG: hypothetical protein K2N17_04280, partial [Clostridia bacterium]|nr:hypothetical protein [Clostridia bacterium]
PHATPPPTSSPARHDIPKLPRATPYACNPNLANGCMQLGWNTVGIFEATGTRLRLIGLYTPQRNAGNYGVKEGMEFTQVTTRAVHSCTFAHVIAGTYHVLAHLDEDCLKFGIDIIESFLYGNKLVAGGFCSHFYGDAENKFSGKLRELCGGNYSELLRHKNINNVLIKLEKADHNFYRTNAFGHMEIGLSCERHGIVLFGDITNTSNSVSSHGKILEVQTRLFESREELIGINLDAIPSAPPVVNN